MTRLMAMLALAVLAAAPFPGRTAGGLSSGLTLDYANTELTGPRADSVSHRDMSPVNSPGTTQGPGGVGTTALLTDPAGPSSLVRDDCPEWRGGAFAYAWAVWARLDAFPATGAPNRFLLNKIGISPVTGNWYREFGLSFRGDLGQLEWATANNQYVAGSHPPRLRTGVDSPFPVALHDWMLIIGEQYHSGPYILDAVSVRSQAHPDEIQTLGPTAQVTPLDTPGPCNEGTWYARNPDYRGDYTWPGGIGPVYHWQGRTPFSKAERATLWNGGVPRDPAL